MAVRANGYGDLVTATREAEVHILDRIDGVDVFTPLPLYLDGTPFSKQAGDMSVGMLQLCNSPTSYWLRNTWGGVRITVAGAVVNKTLGNQILANASPDNFSGVVAQMVAAKLNVTNSGGLAVIDDADTWLADQGLVDANGNLDWDKAFGSTAQQDQATAYAAALAEFNGMAPCR
jgi:hypothetical protein